MYGTHQPEKERILLKERPVGLASFKAQILLPLIRLSLSLSLFHVDEKKGPVLDDTSP